MSRLKSFPNLWPWPLGYVGTANTPPLTYPVGVPQGVAVKWYSRVKSWDVSFTAYAQVTGPGVTYGASGTYTYTMSAGSVQTLAANRFLPPSGISRYVANTEESNLVLPCGPVQGEPVTTGTVVSVPDQGGDENVLLDLSQSGLSVLAFAMFDTTNNLCPLVVDRATGLYYPRIDFTAALGDQIVFAGAPPSTGDTGATPMDMPVNIDGYTYTQQAYIGAGSGYTLTPGSFRCEVNMTPHEYWSYDELYNTSTGAPLTNPATGNPYTLAELVAQPL